MRTLLLICLICSSCVSNQTLENGVNMQPETIARPDLSNRKLKIDVEKTIYASPSEVFDAWTSVKFSKWFASPEAIIMDPVVNKPYFFESRYEGQRHPHYGRFLRLEKDRIVEMTWLTEAGTYGAETVVRVELHPVEKGTHLKLTHSGFPNEKSMKDHEEAWPHALEELNKKIH